MAVLLTLSLAHTWMSLTYPLNFLQVLGCLKVSRNWPFSWKSSVMKGSWILFSRQAIQYGGGPVHRAENFMALPDQFPGLSVWPLAAQNPCACVSKVIFLAPMTRYYVYAVQSRSAQGLFLELLFVRGNDCEDLLLAVVRVGRRGQGKNESQDESSTEVQGNCVYERTWFM